MKESVLFEGLVSLVLFELFFGGIGIFLKNGVKPRAMYSSSYPRCILSILSRLNDRGNGTPFPKNPFPFMTVKAPNLMIFMT